MTEWFIKPDDKHIAFCDDMIAVIRKHSEQLDAAEILALTGHFVGQLIALQDQRKMTPTRALKIVTRNIEVGNKEIIASLATQSAGRA